MASLSGISNAKIEEMNRNHPIRIFWFSSLITVALGLFVVLHLGIGQLWLYAVLVLLEVTSSFDNAIVNSRILARMSPLWQNLFLSVGIVIAVFVVRFLLPIVIVMIAADRSFQSVVSMALTAPAQYAAVLHEATPVINAFGGAFLMMIGMNYFMDRSKDIHWLGAIERRLSQAGRWPSLKILCMLLAALVLYATVDPSYRLTVLIASVVGIVLHTGLELFGSFFAKRQSRATHLIGMAAFASFMYLEVLDASFSFDGVIGAFAITSSVVLIITGLGAGAIWVRSLTLYLLRAGTLGQYRYLEHGAHWAILALSVVMLVKLYHVELPEWFTGSIGLVFIATAVASSSIEKRRDLRHQRG